MNKKRALGISLIFLGLIVFFLKPIAFVTGFTIARDVASVAGLWLYGVGLALMISGAILSTSTVEEMVDEVEEAHKQAKSLVQYQKLKKQYRFMQSQGKSPEDAKAWIIRYHAYPRTSGEFKKGYIDLAKAKEGFYFSETSQEAVEQVEQRHLVEPRDISVVKVKIAKGVYGGLVNKIYTSLGEAEAIMPKKISKANKLIDKGLVVIE